MRKVQLAVTGAALAAFLATPLRLSAQEPMADCPMHAEHTAAAHDLDARGDKVMGFAHDRTAHHFLLTTDGGVIQVEANDPADGASRDAIRQHLTQVAAAFARGDFAMPGAIHDRTLPGVEAMQRLKDAITYRYEETERGGRVRIRAASPEARDAVHAFLRAQIADHRTGDPLEVPASGS